MQNRNVALLGKATFCAFLWGDLPETLKSFLREVFLGNSVANRNTEAFQIDFILAGFFKYKDVIFFFFSRVKHWESFLVWRIIDIYQPISVINVRLLLCPYVRY